VKTSAGGRLLIMQREGVRLHAYRDERGIITIGVGHTAFAGPPVPYMGMAITNVEADQILSNDLGKFEEAVNQAVKVPVSQHAFDAMVSLAFNIGTGGFIGSTVVHKINAGDMQGAADAFLMWDRPPDLIARRRSERAQFLTPDA
jgi:lysozyme